ncbi:MAG: TolC family protein [Polyangiaceae bacterium]
MRAFFATTAFLLASLAPAVAAATPAAAPEKVSFARALELAKARNPNALVAAADIARADALVRQARATSLPSLTAAATYTRLDGDRIVNGRVAQGEDSLNANLNLVVPIVAPQRWSTWRRAEDSARVTRANAASTIRDVTLAAGRAYLAVLLQKKVLRSAVEATTTARAHSEYAETRFKGGVGTRTDFVRSQQELAISESQRSIATASVVRAEEALGVVLGVEHAVDVEDDVPLANLAHAALVGDRPGGDREDAPTRRSDVAAVRDQMLAAERAYRDRWREYMPLLSGTFQPFYQNPPTLTQPLTGWQAQILLAVPLYDGGARYGVSDERQAVMSQTRARFDGVVRQAKADVRVAETLVRESESALVDARRSADLAHEAAKLVRTAYEAGTSTNLELVDADRRARDADIQAAVAEDSLHQASLELLAALGRFP